MIYEEMEKLEKQVKEFLDRCAKLKEKLIKIRN